jgi:hypothetical protein
MTKVVWCHAHGSAWACSKKAWLLKSVAMAPKGGMLSPQQRREHVLSVNMLTRLRRESMALSNAAFT